MGGHNRNDLCRLHSKAAKWLARFHKEAGNHTAVALADASAFVVLNGGLLGGSSPFYVRRELTKAGVIGAEVSADQHVCHFHSSLPFVLVLATPHVVPALLDIGDVAVRGGESARVFAVAVDNRKRDRDRGLAPTTGCGYLFILPVDPDQTLATCGSLFQSRVVGFDGNYDPSVLPPGLTLTTDFVEPAEAACIRAELTTGASSGIFSREFLSRRRVMHFNRRFLYDTNRLGPVGEGVPSSNPTFYEPMRQRLEATLQALDKNSTVVATSVTLDQLTVNDYRCSEGRCGIAAHVDAHSGLGEYIVVISLGSYTVMEFARPFARRGSETSTTSIPKPVLLFVPPNSLLIMRGQARYGWTHAIAECGTDLIDEFTPVQYRGDRLSLTWRSGRAEQHLKRECDFPDLCDGL